MSADKSLGLEVTEREHNILRMLVDYYISDGQPVGSRTLSKLPGVDISAASVRNVMGDLESMGLLKSPHTSAGRIPTSAAYRLFVDSMLEFREPGPETIEEIKSALDPNLSDQALIKVASHYLSGVTEMAGMITVPKRDSIDVKQVEFVPLSDKRVLVILILSDGEIDNRVIRLDREYSKDELEEFARFLNTEYLDRPLAEVRDRLERELHDVRTDMSQRMQLMIEVAGRVLEEEQTENNDDLLVAGETNLMTHSDLSDVTTLRDIFQAFEQKRDIYHLLEQCVSAEGVQIFIGKVAYDKVIPVVDITSRLLSAALNSKK